MSMASKAEAVRPTGEEAIQATVCSALEPFNTHGVELAADTDLTTDLELDSLGVMDLLFELEEQYDVSIPINRLGDVRTVGELVALVRKIMSEG